MARPRLPAAKAETSGATVKNPGRFIDRKAPKATRPLGKPYATMTAPQCAAWEEFRADLPWLNNSHRALLRLACILQVRMEEADVGVNQIQTLSAILSKLAATPVDETKVVHGDDAEEDPADASSPDRTSAYAEAVVAGEIVAGPHVRNACRRHLDDLKRKDGVWFDQDAADDAFGFFEGVLRLSEGQFEGKPFELQPSQAFIVGSLFGWKRADGRRRFRRAYIEQGKGNGKSPLRAGSGSLA
jgi:hypothetical protein